MALVAVDAGLEHEQTERHLAFEIVVQTDHGAFGDVGMGGEHFLDGAGRERLGLLGARKQLAVGKDVEDDLALAALGVAWTFMEPPEFSCFAQVPDMREPAADEIDTKIRG